MKEFFTVILASIEALFHHKPGTTEHEEAKTHLEGVKAELEPDTAAQLDKTVAAAVASHSAPVVPEETPAAEPPPVPVGTELVTIGATEATPPEQPPA
jgi:hypothetical protein